MRERKEGDINPTFKSTCFWVGWGHLQNNGHFFKCASETFIYFIFFIGYKNPPGRHVFNPRRACAARVTIVGLLFCYLVRHSQVTDESQKGVEERGAT